MWVSSKASQSLNDHCTIGSGQADKQLNRSKIQIRQVSTKPEVYETFSVNHQIDR
jgi:hypothetical protein